MDMLSKLPTPIIEDILCLIPIQEAARTSILSKEWRYRWTKIRKLVFDEHTFQISDYVDGYLSDLEERVSNILSQREGTTYWCKLFYAFYQILLKHNGPIHEFTLSIDLDTMCVELDCILLYLSRNFNVQKLTLKIGGTYDLPFSLVSFDRLIELHLCDCGFGNRSTFSVFDSLTSLSISEVYTTDELLLYLLSSCPFLKSLTMMDVCYPDFQDFGRYCTITNLFECIPMVETLSICISTIKEFAKHGVPQVLPMPLIHLKNISIDKLSFMAKYGLPFLLFLVRSSPNLEKLKLRVNSSTYDYLERYDDDFDDQVLRSEKCFSALLSCSNIWFEHMEVLEMNVLYTLNSSNKKHLLDFVKLILANSPMLNTVRIYLSRHTHEDEKLQVSEVLLSSPCATLAVEIVVEIRDLCRFMPF